MKPSSARTTSDSLPAPIVADPHFGLAVALLHGLYEFLWLLALALGSPWWVGRALFDARFRSMVIERWMLRFPKLPPSRGRERLLIHGVSVGEVKCAQALVRALEESHPELEVVISSSTDTGLEVARQLFPDRGVVRFPLDLSFTCAAFLGRIAPCAVVLVELEIWPSFLRTCNRAGVPVAVVNGRVTPKSFGRYRRFRHTLPQFDRVSLFCVQAEEHAERFRSLGGASERVIVTGNMKADGLRLGAVAPKPEIARLLSGRSGQNVIVAGSTHRTEERRVAQAWLEGARQARLVLVPRHPERAAEVLADLEDLGLHAQLLTALRGGAESPDPARPAIVDTIGELENVYVLADLVYVGGSLVPHGGQNMLEPAAQGRAVVFGPNVDNFREEAGLLERAGASCTVRDL